MKWLRYGLDGLERCAIHMNINLENYEWMRFEALAINEHSWIIIDYFF